MNDLCYNMNDLYQSYSNITLNLSICPAIKIEASVSLLGRIIKNAIQIFN